MQVSKLLTVQSLPAYWGKWFRCISDSTMKQTDLNIFYQFGVQLETIRKNCQRNSLLIDAFVYCHSNRGWLVSFLEQTKEVSSQLRRSRACVEQILTAVNAICDSPDVQTVGALVSQVESDSIFWAYKNFEDSFTEESRKLQVFMVTPKGTRHTEILLESPEADFTEAQRKVLPPQFVADLRQAARCLVFEVPTACAFHTCRATESLILAYYGLLAKHPWNKAKKDWKIYIEQLIVEGAPKKITTRLDEIREMDRNSYAHPETNVSIEEAPILYGLCSFVNFYMAEEIVKLKP